jgi:hypothetical protein
MEAHIANVQDIFKRKKNESLEHSEQGVRETWDEVTGLPGPCSSR